MELIEYLNIPYIPSKPQNAAHTFDVYIPKRLTDHSIQYDGTFPLVCFIHGGAWRSEDKADHAGLARKLALTTGYPVALPNYRLTPREPTPDNSLHHPEHAKDILQFLEFLRSWHEGNSESKGSLPYQPNRLFLVGHSCGAHILCSIFLQMESGEINPCDALVQSTAAIIMSEGLYDMDLLLSNFPTYRTWFIESVFGKNRTYEDVSAIKANMDPRGSHIRWLIIHSKGDTLVDEGQSSAMYNYLVENSGSQWVTKTFDALVDEHNDMLKGDQYVEILGKYIEGVVGAHRQ
ncbi:hypothetical protein HYDPIDRAFT_79980 [Hydnomerulius pinastri MD-312]|nr:hypothetical protein HYDPIDRAFT_79980 [Hydnomerulius pinastri MD-312]